MGAHAAESGPPQEMPQDGAYTNADFARAAEAMPDPLASPEQVPLSSPVADPTNRNIDARNDALDGLTANLDNADEGAGEAVRQLDAFARNGSEADFRAYQERIMRRDEQRRAEPKHRKPGENDNDVYDSLIDALDSPKTADQAINRLDEFFRNGRPEDIDKYQKRIMERALHGGGGDAAGDKAEKGADGQPRTEVKVITANTVDKALLLVAERKRADGDEAGAQDRLRLRFVVAQRDGASTGSKHEAPGEPDQPKPAEAAAGRDRVEDARNDAIIVTAAGLMKEGKSDEALKLLEREVTGDLRDKLELGEPQQPDGKAPAPGPQGEPADQAKRMVDNAKVEGPADWKRVAGQPNNPNSPVAPQPAASGDGTGGKGGEQGPPQAAGDGEQPKPDVPEQAPVAADAAAQLAELLAKGGGDLKTSDNRQAALMVAAVYVKGGDPARAVDILDDVNIAEGDSPMDANTKDRLRVLFLMVTRGGDGVGVGDLGGPAGPGGPVDPNATPPPPDDPNVTPPAPVDPNAGRPELTDELRREAEALDAEWNVSRNRANTAMERYAWLSAERRNSHFGQLEKGGKFRNFMRNVAHPWIRAKSGEKTQDLDAAERDFRDNLGSFARLTTDDRFWGAGRGERNIRNEKREAVIKLDYLRMADGAGGMIIDFQKIQAASGAGEADSKINGWRQSRQEAAAARARGEQPEPFSPELGRMQRLQARFAQSWRKGGKFKRGLMVAVPAAAAGVGIGFAALSAPLWAPAAAAVAGASYVGRKIGHTEARAVNRYSSMTQAGAERFNTAANNRYQEFASGIDLQNVDPTAVDITRPIRVGTEAVAQQNFSRRETAGTIGQLAAAMAAGGIRLGVGGIHNANGAHHVTPTKPNTGPSTGTGGSLPKGLNVNYNGVPWDAAHQLAEQGYIPQGHEMGTVQQGITAWNHLHPHELIHLAADPNSPGSQWIVNAAGHAQTAAQQAEFEKIMVENVFGLAAA